MESEKESRTDRQEKYKKERDRVRAQEGGSGREREEKTLEMTGHTNDVVSTVSVPAFMSRLQAWQTLHLILAGSDQRLPCFLRSGGSLSTRRRS